MRLNMGPASALERPPNPWTSRPASERPGDCYDSYPVCARPKRAWSSGRWGGGTGRWVVRLPGQAETAEVTSRVRSAEPAGAVGGVAGQQRGGERGDHVDRVGLPDHGRGARGEHGTVGGI